MKILKLIKFNLYKDIENFLYSKKIYRKLILISFDYLSLYISWLIAIIIFKDINQNINIKSVLYHFWSIQAFTLPVYLLTNQYKPLTRFINNSSFYLIILRNIFLISIPILYLDVVRFQNPKLTFWIIFLLLTILFQIGYRLLIRDLINFLINRNLKNKQIRIAIYKADYLGFQLSNILKIEGKYNIVCFLDDSPALDGSSINTIPILFTNVWI